jgi:hypothetical protein
MSPFFKPEEIKDIKKQGINQSKILREFDYQKGSSNKIVDKKRTALPPGKRISRSGKIYWESRKNRSDITNV